MRTPINPKSLCATLKITRNVLYRGAADTFNMFHSQTSHIQSYGICTCTHLTCLMTHVDVPSCGSGSGGGALGLGLGVRCGVHGTQLRPTTFIVHLQLCDGASATVRLSFDCFVSNVAHRLSGCFRGPARDWRGLGSVRGRNSKI